MRKGEQAMPIQSPRDLFFYNLCAIYDVEQKLVQILSQLAQESVNPQAREIFMQHEQETRQHVRNLEQCFQILGTQPTAVENHTVTGLRWDHDTFLQQRPPQEALTMFDLYAGYQTEFLEIATYQTLIDAANSMGLQQCVQLFQQNLQQEEAAARKLATVAHQLGLQQAQAAQAPVVPPPQSQYYGAAAPPPQGQPYTATPPPPMSQPYPPTPPPSQSSYTPPSSQTANPSATTPSQTGYASQVRRNMEVIGSDMQKVGNVLDTRENDFLVDIPMGRDVYVPFTAIQNVDENRVVLNIPAYKVNDMNWPNRC